MFGIPREPSPEPAPGRATRSADTPRNRVWNRIDRTFVGVVLLGTLLGGLIGGAWGSTHPPQYAGRADFLIDATVDLTGQATGGQQATDRDVSTQAALLGNRAVHDTAAGLLNGKVEFSAKTISDHDSNLLSVMVTAPTDSSARRARKAYVRAYLELVAIQQRRLLTPQLAVVKKTITEDLKQIQLLDKAVNQAKADQRSLLVAQQSGQRVNVTSDLRDNQQRQSRLEAAADALPVNVESLPVETPVEPTGLKAWQWLALGLALGAGIGAVICLRIAERRSLASL